MYGVKKLSRWLAHLDAVLPDAQPRGEFFPQKDIGILCLLEDQLQLVQLVVAVSCPRPLGFFGLVDAVVSPVARLRVEG